MRADFQLSSQVSDIPKERLRISEFLSSCGLWFALAVAGIVVFRPILWSAYSADDTFDSLVPMNLKYSSGSFWSLVNEVVSGWKTNEGRFFPVAVLVGGLSHILFPERESYKLAQFLSVLIVLLMLAAIVALLTRNNWAGILAGLLLLSASQMRVQYDPFLQFSLQQPALMTLVLSAAICFVLAIRKESTAFLFASLVAFFAATLTYESSSLLWPIFPFLALFERRKDVLRWVVPTVIAPLIAIVHLLYLRSQVSTTSSGYTSNFEVPTLLRTFLKQAGASLPMSYAEINTPPFILGMSSHLRPSDPWWIAGISLTAVLSMVCLMRVPRCSWPQIASLVMVGLTLWVLPALVVAQTTRWQTEIVAGNAYIPVYQGNIGFSIAAIGIILALVRLVRPKTWIAKVLSSTLVVVLCLAVSSVVSNNPRAVAQYDASFRYMRDVFTSSAEDGLFDNYRATGQVLTLNPDWWLTASLVYWYSGTRLGRFITPQTPAEFSSCINTLDDCKTTLNIDLYLGTYGRLPSETRVVLVGNVERLTGQEGKIKGIRVSSPRVYVVYPDSAPSNSISDSMARCVAWFRSRMWAAGESIDASSVTVVRATEKYCLVRTDGGVTLNPMKFTPS